jgi:hypothetical protein
MFSGIWGLSMSARKRVVVLGSALATLLTVAGAIPTFAQIYGGQAYAVQLTSVAVNSVPVTDQIVDGTPQLPPGGGSVNATAGIITLPSGLGTATVAQEQASGAQEISSASSQIASISILPNLTLPAPLTGTDLLSGTNLSSATSLGCGAASSVSTEYQHRHADHRQHPGVDCLDPQHLGQRDSPGDRIRSDRVGDLQRPELSAGHRQRHLDRRRFPCHGSALPGLPRSGHNLARGEYAGLPPDHQLGDP